MTVFIYNNILFCLKITNCWRAVTAGFRWVHTDGCEIEIESLGTQTAGGEGNLVWMYIRDKEGLEGFYLLSGEN